MKLTNNVFMLDQNGQSPFMASFVNLMNQDFSLSKAMNILSISSQIDLRLERYAKLRMKLINRHGEKLENDKYQVPPEKIEEFLVDMNELNAMEFEIEGEVIDLTGENITLKASDLMRLKPILSPLPDIKIPDEVEDENE